MSPNTDWSIHGLPNEQSTIVVSSSIRGMRQSLWPAYPAVVGPEPLDAVPPLKPPDFEPVIDPARCSGCARCVDECPVGAIDTVPYRIGTLWRHHEEGRSVIGARIEAPGTDEFVHWTDHTRLADARRGVCEKGPIRAARSVQVPATRFLPSTAATVGVGGMPKRS